MYAVWKEGVVSWVAMDWEAWWEKTDTLIHRPTILCLCGAFIISVLIYQTTKTKAENKAI